MKNLEIHEFRLLTFRRFRKKVIQNEREQKLTKLLKDKDYVQGNKEGYICHVEAEVYSLMQSPLMYNLCKYASVAKVKFHVVYAKLLQLLASFLSFAFWMRLLPLVLIQLEHHLHQVELKETLVLLIPTQKSRRPLLDRRRKLVLRILRRHP